MIKYKYPAVLFVFVLALVFAAPGTGSAQDEAQYIDDGEGTSQTTDYCPGGWTIMYDGGWYLEQRGQRLEVTWRTNFYNCLGESVAKSEKYVGLKAEVECRREEAQDGSVSIYPVKVTIICE